ncbi:TetR/AcrR family transcriptional regulator [Vibrio parahaemolyticus]|nr:TetR/AcrR family transcriptional regulator [Vibrio parahaemolyticus]WMN90539.1 TetR/AcrR family transcriptional regulator [Vibrio parahaemolyticus]WMO08196.1 TetR/AcrR family transcriptional regulator [Vibrio parahaemolyticus]
MTRKRINKQKAIDSTLALCLKHSFHGTSIDAITAATGMSKATIYRHFNSKEQLIEDALNYYKRDYLLELSTGYNSPTLSLEEKLSLPFKMLKETFDKELFMGCCIQKALNEYCNENSVISNVCLTFKQERTELLETLLLNNHISRAKERSVQGELIFSGLLSTLQVNDSSDLIDITLNMYLNIMSKCDWNPSKY